jgi:chromosome transmission fidelity protein 1
MDSICGIYSCDITLSQLQRGREQLVVYLQKFRNRLKGKNRVYVAQIVRVLDSLMKYLESKVVQKSDKDGEVQVHELLSYRSVDQINLYKLNAYIQESRLARKVDGYTLHTLSKGHQNLADVPEIPVLMQIQSFMVALMNPSTEGRFFYSVDGSEVILSYMLLDAAPHFQSIVSSARAIILAGGTMSPMDDYITHLFPSVDHQRIMTLSCGHIVPASSLVVYPVSHGLNGEELEFTFEKRGRRQLIVAAGEILLRIVTVVPDGVVAFFPSYGYLDTCLGIWKTTLPPSSHKQYSSLLDAINASKPLFCESKASPQTHQSSTELSQPNLAAYNKHSSSESLLTSYTAAIQQPSTSSRGALLLAVLSGSLSEGINFSDELGRCVLVFGLPFPNPHSATWKAKRAYISTKACAAAKQSGNGDAEASAAGHQAAAEFYLNATMRAVNQAVGRAIRHKNDYAAIILVDKRYEGARVKEKLPGWMKESIDERKSVNEVTEGLKVFFKTKDLMK